MIPGDKVRLRHNLSLGEVVVLKICPSEVVVDLGSLHVGFQKDSIILPEDWKAVRAEARRLSVRRKALREKNVRRFA